MDANYTKQPRRSRRIQELSNRFSEDSSPKKSRMTEPFNSNIQIGCELEMGKWSASTSLTLIRRNNTKSKRSFPRF